MSTSVHTATIVSYEFGAYDLFLNPRDTSEPIEQELASIDVEEGYAYVLFHNDGDSPEVYRIPKQANIEEAFVAKALDNGEPRLLYIDDVFEFDGSELDRAPYPTGLEHEYSAADLEQIKASTAQACPTRTTLMPT